MYELVHGIPNESHLTLIEWPHMAYYQLIG
jgi:hypothetical protein